MLISSPHPHPNPYHFLLHPPPPPLLLLVIQFTHIIGIYNNIPLRLRMTQHTIPKAVCVAAEVASLMEYGTAFSQASRKLSTQ